MENSLLICNSLLPMESETRLSDLATADQNDTPWSLGPDWKKFLPLDHNKVLFQYCT